MDSGGSRTVLPVILVSLLLILAGVAYLLFLNALYPMLVPHYGGGERFALRGVDDFTLEMPWGAVSRLHLSFQANGTVALYLDGAYVGNYTSYGFTVEGGDVVMVSMRSVSPVGGMFTARQEVPLGRQLTAVGLLLVGFSGLVFSRRWAGQDI